MDLGRRSLSRPATVVAAAVAIALVTAAPAAAAITATNDDDAIASAIVADPSVLAGASWQYGPSAADANGVGDSSLASFPAHGQTYGILTSGQADVADEEQGQTYFADNENSGGPRSPGGNDLDVSVLRVDVSVPQGKNCLSIEFRFLSEEYPDFVGSSFNDAFIAELDSTTWTTGTDGETEEPFISAPNNFAFDPDGNVISINSSGVANMTATEASGTVYGGATQLLRASTPVTQGAHSVYLTIFDQGDRRYDSAVFLDNLALGTTTEGGCEPGASLPPPTVSKSADGETSEPGATNGYTITITNQNDSSVELESITDALPAGFSYVAGSSTGATTSDPAQDGQTLVWSGPFTVPAATNTGPGTLQLNFDVTVASDSGEYFNEATASAEGFNIGSTGPTAKIVVLGDCEPVTVEATGGSDKLVGTSEADRIKGLGGRDVIDGKGAGDELCGGPGSDFLYGRGGADLLLGDTGNDRVYGGGGADSLDGEQGHDALFGNTGADQIEARDGQVDCIVRDPDDTVRRDAQDLVNPARGCDPGFWL